MYRLALCGIVLALSHGASLPLGFEAGQQINLVINRVNRLRSRSGCESGRNIYIVCYHANYYARLQVESDQSFQEKTYMYMYMYMFT